MEGESDDPEGSQSFDQHSANCELYGVHGSLWTNSILFLISEVYNFLSTIFDSLLLTLLLSSTLKMISLFFFLYIYIFFVWCVNTYSFLFLSWPTCIRIYCLLIFFEWSPIYRNVSQTYDPILDGQINDSCGSKMVPVCISIVDVLSSDLLNSRLLYCCVRSGDFSLKQFHCLPITIRGPDR